MKLSGTSNLAVGDVTGHGGKLLTFSDNQEGIYEYEVKREQEQPYSQRTADVKVIETGEETGVRTYIIMPPLVYGRGEGLFNKSSQQIPTLIRNAIKAGRAEYIAPSSIGHVHVADLASLFETVLAQALVDEKLPTGRNGFFFSESGEHTWAEVAELIAKAGARLGALKSDEPVLVTLGEAAGGLAGGDEGFTESIFASS